MNKCQGCRYFVTVIGQHRSRQMCVAIVSAYRTGAKLLNGTVNLQDLILLLGKEKLESMLGNGSENMIACGEFELMV